MTVTLSRLRMGSMAWSARELATEQRRSTINSVQDRERGGEERRGEWSGGEKEMRGGGEGVAMKCMEGEERKEETRKNKGMRIIDSEIETLALAFRLIDSTAGPARSPSSPLEGSFFSCTECSSECSALDVSIPALMRFSVT